VAEDWKDKLRRAFFTKQAGADKSPPKDVTNNHPVASAAVSQQAAGLKAPTVGEPKSRIAGSRDNRAIAPTARPQIRDPRAVGSMGPGSPEVDAHIGIDFGTRFTKVALHLPHVDVRKVLSLREASGRLFPSRLLIGDDDLIYPPDLEPRLANASIEYLKMRLAEPETTIFGSMRRGAEISANIRALSALFLAGVIRLAQQASLREPTLAGRRVVWMANVGVPVKYCDSSALLTFREVCGVAWQWREEKPSPFDMKELRRAYGSTVGQIAGALDDLPIRVAPELTAALAHFGDNRNTAPGLYAFIDIGGGTLDGSAFELRRGPNGPEFTIYAAEVDELGTMALAHHALGEIERDLEAGIETQLILGGMAPSISIPPQKLELRKSEERVQKLLHRVGAITRKKQPGLRFSDDLYASSRKLQSIANPAHPVIPVFLSGGGARSEWYQSLFRRTSADFNEHQYGIGGYDVRLLPRPPGNNDDDYLRFVIATGLASARLHWNQYQLPSAIESPPPPPDWHPPFQAPVTKDMV